MRRRVLAAAAAMTIALAAGPSFAQETLTVWWVTASDTDPGGSVQWTMPKIKIEAHGDEMNGIVVPFKHDYAISTDAGFSQPDETLQLLQGHDAAIKDSATPSIGHA